jgi:hypothetical protein
MSQIFRAIDNSGDWLFGAGRQSYLRDNAAIMADVRTALLMFYRDCFFAMDAGVDWWDINGGKLPSAEASAVAQTRAVISKIDGVVRIDRVDTRIDRRTRSLTITYELDTIFTQRVVGSLNLDPSALPFTPTTDRAGYSFNTVAE